MGHVFVVGSKEQEMGVKTKVFGPFGWVMLEGVARAFDRYLTQETDSDKRLLIKDLMREFLFLIGFVLPCVYCRVSYREFTDPAHPCNRHCDINRVIGEPDGAKQFVYHLHKRVGIKLRDQEREKARHDPAALARVNEAWDRYHLSFSDALRTRFPSANSRRFWRAAVMFMGLVCCDWRPADSCYVHRWFWVLGKILCQTGCRLGPAYFRAFDQGQPLWTAHMNLDTRLDLVWAIQRRVFEAGGWDFAQTRQQFGETCRSAIVGCGGGAK